MAFDAISSGFPSASSYNAGSNSQANALDTHSGATWNNSGNNGWQPDSSAFAKAFALGVTAAQTALLVVTAPQTGIYQIIGYAAQSTATGTTPGAFQVAYTEGDTGAAIAAVSFDTPAALTTLGSSNVATTTINAKAGTTITVSSLVVGGTGGAVNLKARISYLG
jgi:hypothetical protein